MSYTLKHIYIKPNAELNVNFWSGDILNLIDTYFDAGKITQKPVKTTDGSIIIPRGEKVGVGQSVSYYDNALGQHVRATDIAIPITNFDHEEKQSNDSQ